MAVLTDKQIASMEKDKINCCNCKPCVTCQDTLDVIETLRFREWKHEKARHEVELKAQMTYDTMLSCNEVSMKAVNKLAEKIKQLGAERDRLKAHKPYCYIKGNGDKCYGMAYATTGKPKEACNDCHWREVEAE